MLQTMKSAANYVLYHVGATNVSPEARAQQQAYLEQDANRHDERSVADSTRKISAAMKKAAQRGDRATWYAGKQTLAAVSNIGAAAESMKVQSEMLDDIMVAPIALEAQQRIAERYVKRAEAQERRLRRTGLLGPKGVKRHAMILGRMAAVRGQISKLGAVAVAPMGFGPSSFELTEDLEAEFLADAEAALAADAKRAGS